MNSRAARLISTFFGAGLAPKAPGTFGTLAALPVGWLIGTLFGMPGLLLAAVAAYALGVLAVARYCTDTGREDPGEVVIDEAVGVWIVMAFLPLNFSGVAVAFVLFRFFDILKPWPVCRVDSTIKGSHGVMLDDVLAGLYPVVLLSIAGYGFGTWDWYGFLSSLP